MKLFLHIAVLVLFFLGTKGYSLKKIVENSVSETDNSYQKRRDSFISFLPDTEKSEKNFSVENANDNEHARKKRTLLSAAAFGTHALRRQQLRWQNKLERTRLRNERYKLRNDYRLKAMNDTNQKLKAQIDQWNIKQQLNRQRYEQRWADINKQLLYPMNFQEYFQTQNKMSQQLPPLNFQQHQLLNTMNPQHFPPLNFKQHQLPNTILHSTSTVRSTTNLGQIYMPKA